VTRQERSLAVGDDRPCSCGKRAYIKAYNHMIAPATREITMTPIAPISTTSNFMVKTPFEAEGLRDHRI
jgi:hypothetical protein